jgi:hypothetical protein
VLEVDQWAELRREHFVRGVPIKGAGAADGVVAERDPGGAAVGCVAGVSVPGAGVEARSVQRSIGC